MWGKNNAAVARQAREQICHQGMEIENAGEGEKLINKISDQQEPSVRSQPPPQSKAGADVAWDAALSQDAQAAILMKQPRFCCDLMQRSVLLSMNTYSNTKDLWEGLLTLHVELILKWNIQ